MHKFPKIKNIRNMQKTARRFGIDREVRFDVTPKIHGTNAALVEEDGEVYAQSRNRKLSLDADPSEHFGFVGFAARTYTRVSDVSAVVFGEWAGPGIQHNVGICGIPEKSFFAYAVKVLDPRGAKAFGLYPRTDFRPGVVVRPVPGEEGYTIHPITTITINPATFVYEGSGLQKLTESIGEECPVAAYFGVKGIGEGIVCRPYVEDLPEGFDETELWFKCKALAYTEVAGEPKPKTTCKDTTNYVRVNALATPRRLEQGLEYLQEMGIDLEPTAIGTYIKWVVGDAEEEEGPLCKETKRGIGVVAGKFIRAKVGV